MPVREKMETQPDHFHRDIIGKPEPWKQEDWERLLPQIGDVRIRPPAHIPTAQPVCEAGEWWWVADEGGTE